MPTYFTRKIDLQVTIFMKKLFILSILVLMLSPLWARIPDSLFKEANAIILDDNYVYEIKEITKATSRIQKKILILNEKGYEQTQIYCQYDKYTDISGLKAGIYDINEIKIRDLNRDEIKDESLGNLALATDARVKYLSFNYAKYPFILEVEYTISHRNLMFYPIWQPQPDYGISVLSASFVVESPEAIPIRYLNQKIPNREIKQSKNGLRSYTWKIENILALKEETYAVPLHEKTPVVYTAATDFKVESYQGKMSTWEDIGKWYHWLNLGRDIISPTLQEKAQNLTKNAADAHDKVRILYQYLQQNTRYVSIQLGIGSWQTASAELVETKGYGDCKALTNFMKTLLAAIDIKAYPALIRAGEDAPKITPTFPCMYFNHVILCVPLEKDTMWLECTSQREAPGFLSTFTDNRWALLVQPSGGVLVKTPNYSCENNLIAKNINILLDEKGNADAHYNSVYNAQTQAWSGLSTLMYETSEKQKEWLQKKLTFGNSLIDSLRLQVAENQMPASIITAKLTLISFASKSSKRMFICPNMASAVNAPTLITEIRKTPFYLSQNIMYQDTITITYPENFQVETLIKPTMIENEFGFYNVICEDKGGKLRCFRQFILKQGTFEAAKYADFVQFAQNVAKSDAQKVVLVTR